MRCSTALGIPEEGPQELERRRAATHSWYLAYKQALVASVQARVRALERKTPRER